MKLFDLHCDTITECYKRKASLRENELNISLLKGENIENWCQLYAIWMPNEYRGDDAVQYYENIRSFYISEINVNKDRIFFCKNYADMVNTFTDKKHAAVLTVEGGAAAAGDISRIYKMHQDGVRLMTLTWNGSCEIACGSDVEGGKGLTDFGKEAVSLMEELGMIVDVSHINDIGFYDVAKIANKPFIATHSNSREVYPHRRNLTDDQFKIIRDNGGLVGLNFYNAFLGENCKNGREGILRHLYHFLELGGENTVAIGSDFDGADMFDDLSDITKIESLYNYLIYRGIDKNTVDKVFYQNAMNYFKRVL